MRGGPQAHEIYKKRTHCPYCERKLSASFHKKRSVRKGERVREAFRQSRLRGTHVGRKRSVDYVAAREAYAKLKSLREAAKFIGCSPWSIKRALKELRKAPSNE